MKKKGEKSVVKHQEVKQSQSHNLLFHPPKNMWVHKMEPKIIVKICHLRSEQDSTSVSSLSSNGHIIIYIQIYIYRYIDLYIYRYIDL